MIKSFTTRVNGYSSVSFFLAIAFFSIGTVMLLNRELFFVFLYIIGIGFLTTFNGAVVNMKRKEAKEGLVFFGIKFGTWRSLKNYSSVLVSIGSRKVPRYGYVATYQIFLVSMDKNINPSILLANIGSKDKAIKKAEKYSSNTGLPFKSNLK